MIREIPLLLCDSFCQHFNHADVRQQFRRETVPLLQIGRANIRDPNLALAIFPDQNLEREIDRNAGRRHITGVPPFGFPKMNNLVGRIFIPAFAASPL
jgi:uncharacterized protein (DUF2141 family)